MSKLLKKIKVLVICDQLIRSGGLLRFDRVANVIKNWGYELYFLPLSNKNRDIKLNAKIINKADALKIKWDVTMIPGAGFPEETIKQFGEFTSSNYGLRIQHILNDKTRKLMFLKVNSIFKPHLVIFNNKHWGIGEYKDFQANEFYYLIGGVDARSFYPTPLKIIKNNNTKFVIGGQVRKNPEVLIESLYYLPENYEISLFGNDVHNISEKYRNLIEKNQLHLLGELDNDKLIDFYQSVDVAVSTEEYAGWSNICAEAMACGVPVICTEHGTLSYAIDNETALLIKKIDSKTISEKIKKISSDSMLRYNLANNGRKKILEFDWVEYSSKLCGYFNYDYTSHY